MTFLLDARPSLSTVIGSGVVTEGLNEMNASEALPTGV